MSIKGKGKQPHESWDEYCSRVDLEIYEAGEERKSVSHVLRWWIIFLGVIAAGVMLI